MTSFYRIYADDTGNLDENTSNSQETRYGGVTAVILHDDYLRSTFNPSFEALSRKHFGTREDGSCHNIHRRRISSPRRAAPFDVLDNPDRLAAWTAESLSMLRRAEYTVITACVDKVAWYHRYPEWSGDFYDVVVQAVLERTFYFLKNRSGSAQFNIETKNPKSDQRIKAAYKKALEDGFDYIRAEALRKRFTSSELNIIQKSQCIPGLQLADLLAQPALQHVRHLETGRHPIATADAKAVAALLEDQKFYREGSNPGGYGRVWRPRKT